MPRLRAPHWIIAAGLLAPLWLGFFDAGLAPPALLRWHMAGGIVIFALMLLRIGLRLRAKLPGNRSHYGPYALVGALAATGFATAALYGLIAVTFCGVTPAKPQQWQSLLDRASLPGDDSRCPHRALAVTGLRRIANNSRSGKDPLTYALRQPANQGTFR